MHRLTATAVRVVLRQHVLSATREDQVWVLVYVVREVLRFLHLLWVTSVVMPRVQFTAQYNLRQAVVFHSEHMPCPAKSCLKEHDLDIRLLEDRDVG